MKNNKLLKIVLGVLLLLALGSIIVFVNAGNKMNDVASEAVVAQQLNVIEFTQSEAMMIEANRDQIEPKYGVDSTKEVLKLDADSSLYKALSNLEGLTSPSDIENLKITPIDGEKFSKFTEGKTGAMYDSSNYYVILGGNFEGFVIYYSKGNPVIDSSGIEYFNSEITYKH